MFLKSFSRTLVVQISFNAQTDMYTTKLDFSLHTCAETGLLQIEFGLCKF